MTTHDHNHAHDHAHAESCHHSVDQTMVRRLRFLKLILDTLLLADNDNREQAYKAGLRMLEIIGVQNANQPASEKMNPWVFAKELMNGIEPDITATPLPDEVVNFFLRVEALADMPLKGREEVWVEEQKRLAELSIEKPVAGLMRLIMLARIMVLKRELFAEVDISPEQVVTSQHLINQDLMNWKQMNMKPHWFTDEFLVFRETEAERAGLEPDELAARQRTEEELVFKLFMIRHNSPEGLNLVKFYKQKLDEARASAENENIGDKADEKISEA